MPTPAAIPPTVAADVAATLATIPRGRRAIHVESIAAIYGVSPATVYRAAAPYRKRSQATPRRRADYAARARAAADQANHAARQARESTALAIEAARTAEAMAATFDELRTNDRRQDHEAPTD